MESVKETKDNAYRRNSNIYRQIDKETGARLRPVSVMLRKQGERRALEAYRGNRFKGGRVLAIKSSQ